MIIGVDHVLVAVDNLDDAMETYRQLGFQVQPGGEHPGRGTYNALVPLSDGFYFELMGVKDKSLAEKFAPSRRVVDALDRENHLATFALDSNKLDSDVASIRGRELMIGDPNEGERTRPDGQRVAWRSALPEDSALPFLIQDVTPRETRSAPPTEGLGRWLRVADVVFGVNDLEARRAAFARLFGVNPSADRFEFSRGAIQLEAIDTDEGLLRITLLAEDIGRVAEQLRAQDKTFRERVIEGVGVVLEPVDTEGVPLQIIGRAS